MELAMHIIAGIVIIAGAFFLFAAGLGIIRFPDFYCRAHAQGKADTLGIMLIIFGLVITQGVSINSAKLLIIIGFVALAGPTATNALLGAAFKFRLKPWFKKEHLTGNTNEVTKEEKD